MFECHENNFPTLSELAILTPTPTIACWLLLQSAESRVLALDIFFAEPLHGRIVDDESVLATITSVARCRICLLNALLASASDRCWLVRVLLSVLDESLRYSSERSSLVSVLGNIRRRRKLEKVGDINTPEVLLKHRGCVDGRIVLLDQPDLHLRYCLILYVYVKVFGVLFGLLSVIHLVLEGGLILGPILAEQLENVPTLVLATFAAEHADSETHQGAEKLCLFDVCHIHVSLDQVFEHAKDLTVEVGALADIREEVRGKLVDYTELCSWLGSHGTIDCDVSLGFSLLDVVQTLIQEYEDANEAVNGRIAVEHEPGAGCDAQVSKAMSDFRSSTTSAERCIAAVIFTILTSTLENATQKITLLGCWFTRLCIDGVVECRDGIITNIHVRSIAELGSNLVTEPFVVETEEKWDKLSDERGQSWELGGMHLLGVQENQMRCVDDYARVLELEGHLRVVARVLSSQALSLCLFISGMDFAQKSLGLELTLVGLFGINSLVVQTLPEHLLCLITPDLLPLTLSLFPLLKLLLESVQQHRNDLVRLSVERLDNHVALLASVKLHDDALVDCLALSTESGRNLKSLLFTVVHAENLLCNGLKQLDRARTSLNVEVVVVAFFLDLVESFFVDVLPVSDETRVLRCPCWMRGPVVVEHFIAKLVTSTARLQSLALGEETVTWPKSSAVAQGNSTCRSSRLVLDGHIVTSVTNPHLEPLEEIGVAANEATSLVHQSSTVDQVLGEEVAELQELVHGGLVADRLLSTVEEAHFVLRRKGALGWRQRLRKCRNQGRRRRRDVRWHDLSTSMSLLGAFVDVGHLTISWSFCETICLRACVGDSSLSVTTLSLVVLVDSWGGSKVSNGRKTVFGSGSLVGMTDSSCCCALAAAAAFA
ncbi:hypothetical protein KCU81_g246, partial [Aureobasidium melanogenum]